MKNVSVMLCGVGGYGKLIVNEILDNFEDLGITLEGIVEPYPNCCERLEELKAHGAKVYSDIKDFYAEKKCDLAVITTPIQFHTSHIITALGNGSNVICEKPLCADENDIEKIIAARDRAKKFVYIGYQWSHNYAIGALKSDIMDGLYGKPLDLKTLVIWPRNSDYFHRGICWAGKIKSKDGSLIYDSIANNAAAHYLHNMLYILGGKVNEALSPCGFEADLLRANSIENFDTADIRCNFECGAKARFTATHSTVEGLNPVFNYNFENGRVLFCQDKIPSDDETDGKNYVPGKIVGYFKDGTVKEYGDPFYKCNEKFYIALETIRGEENGFERCGIETAAVHTRLINKIQKTCEIHNVNPELIKVDGKLTYVEGLYKAVSDIYKTGKGSLERFE